MLSLVETIIAFSVIMLMLSFLVKSMTSVAKVHLDYYSKNLVSEVERCILGTVGLTWDDCKKRRPWLKNIKWERLGDEFLSTENIEWLLGELGIKPDVLVKQKKNLEARLKIHRENLKYAFTKQTVVISLAMGLALCLAMNINAFTIWNTLYTDQGVRAKFSSPESIQAAEAFKDDVEKQILQVKDPIKLEELKGQREELLKQIAHFRGKVDFGMGRIWTGGPKEGPGAIRFFLYEFLGSLLTGILVSIGAPYWHDILRAMANLRGLGKPGGTQPGSDAGAGGSGSAPAPSGPLVIEVKTTPAAPADAAKA